MPKQMLVQCLRCGHLNAVEDANGQPGVADGVARTVTILVSLAAVVVAAFAAFAPTESTDIGKARAFLGAYYGNAPFQPETTWDKLLGSYKENGAARDPALDFEAYKEYFEQFSVMTVTDVTNYKATRGEWYAATVYRLNKNGDSATTRYAFQLQCPWQSRLPGFSCSASNLQISNVCEVQKSGLCNEDEAIYEENQAAAEG